MGHIYLPQPLASEIEGSDHGHGPAYEPVWTSNTGVSVIDDAVQPLDFVFTKFMAIELFVAIISILLFGWLATRIRSGKAAKGWFC